MHLPNSKPKPVNWKVVLTTSMVVAALLFPSYAQAADESPSPSPSPTVSVSPSPSPSPETTADPQPVIYDIDTASSLTVVVNKKRPLTPITYKPKLTTTGGIYVAPETAAAYKQLKAAVLAQKLGTLCINSGYRSYSSQKAIHAARVSALGKTAGEKLAARPGFSEHQTGLAIDISTTALSCRIGSFGSSRASKWIEANAWQYGFIVRYPSNSKTAVTGYVWEPWHLRYVGLELATDMQAKNIKTLEEYFGLPAAAKY
jgi:D-alanyl-D-alanine carboxypeptidase